MKLNQPEGTVILILEPGDGLTRIAGTLAGDGELIAHARDPEAMEAIVQGEAGGISLILATDETAPYDTLAVLEAYRHAPWFAGALCAVFAGAHDPAREERALAIGVQDYVVLPPAEDEGALSAWISRELRLSRRLQQLRSFAHRDGLTGFYNHAAAEDVITRTLRHHPGQEFAFAILDIDYFKQVNDVRGHEFGDAVLTQEALRIRSLLSGQALAVRYGGDEFVLLLPMDGDPEAIAQAVCESARFTLEDYPVTSSIGLSTTRSAGRSWEALFRQADLALYTAKANGRNRCCLYRENMSRQLDGASEEIRSETLNLGAGSLIHALVNGCLMACHLDLEKVAITRLDRTASGAYGWSDPVEYIPFIRSLLDRVEEQGRLRFSEFINPNTLAARLKDAPTLPYCFAGADGRDYRVTYLAGDRDADGQVINALMLLGEATPAESEHAAAQDIVTAIEKCLASGMTDAYNAIWIIHPTTLSREIVSIQTDISRHRRINRLFEGGNYWEDTQGYVRLYVNEDERESLLEALHPDVLLRRVEEKGMYTLYFHRRIDGITHRCEYAFTRAMYGEEKVILQLYRRIR